MLSGLQGFRRMAQQQLQNGRRFRSKNLLMMCSVLRENSATLHRLMTIEIMENVV